MDQASPVATIEPKPQSAAAIAPGAAKPAPDRARSARVVRVLLAGLLGVVTTFGISAALASWVSLDPSRAAAFGPLPPAIPGAPARPTPPTALPQVVISADGDHLQPWHILLKAPGSHREVWFEKGRVYGGSARFPAAAPAGASDAAISCWSFATSCRYAAPIKTPVSVSEQISELIAATADHPVPQAWGVAIDRRGWPLPAFSTRIVGVLDRAAVTPWAIEHGADLDSVTDPRGAALAVGRSANLGTIRAIPFKPLWPGLLADSALYAAAWYGLLLLPAVVLGKFRKRAGACPSCGYDLQGQTQPGCPECGWQRATPSPPTAPTAPSAAPAQPAQPATVA